jgi:antitoxin PrlF
MTTEKARIAANGRLVVPVAVRRALGLRPNDDVLFALEEDGVRLFTRAGAVRRAQAAVRRAGRPGADLVGDLFAERRREHAREEAAARRYAASRRRAAE